MVQLDPSVIGKRIYNPFDDTNILSLNQLEGIYYHVEDIISNLDDVALKEMMSGNEQDIDTIINIMVEETKEALYNPVGPIKAGTFGYLEKLTDTFHKELTYRSLNYFILSTLPNFEINYHHIEWGNMVLYYEKLGIIAARDHGKSYFFSFAYPLWQLYRYDKNYVGDLGVYKRKVLSKGGIIITNEYSLAKDFLRFIKAEIEENPILRERLYSSELGYWGESEILCSNGALLKIKGSGSALRGRHPGWISVDDLLDESSLYSKNQRDQIIEYFHSVIMNMIIPGGQVIVTGTPFHLNDLYANLKQSKGWRVFEYPGILPDGRVLWPERYDLESLLNKKLSQGSISFSREILVKPISSDSSIFPWSILQKSFVGMDNFSIIDNIYSSPKKFKKVVLGCDFAISGNVGADFCSFISLGVDDLDNFWLLNLWHKKGASYNEQIAVIRDLRRKFNYSTMMGEDNQFQKVMIDLCVDAGIPMIGHTTNVNKYDFKIGLPALSVLFEQGRIKFPRGDKRSREVTDIVCTELNSMAFTDKGLVGTTEHDDIPISLWIGVTAAHFLNKEFKFSFV